MQDITQMSYELYTDDKKPNYELLLVGFVKHNIFMALLQKGAARVCRVDKNNIPEQFPLDPQYGRWLSGQLSRKLKAYEAELERDDGIRLITMQFKDGECWHEKDGRWKLSVRLEGLYDELF